jgi:hypothetical protein
MGNRLHVTSENSKSNNKQNKTSNTMETLPLDSYYEIIMFGGLTCVPSLLGTCSNIYNIVNNADYSVFIWLSQYLSKIQQEISISSNDKKYQKQLRSLYSQHEEVMKRLERRELQQVEQLENNSYKVQAVYNMLKQFCYSCYLKSIRHEMEVVMKELKQLKNLTGTELIQQYRRYLVIPDKLNKFISQSDSGSEQKIQRDKVKFVNVTISGSSPLIYLLSRYVTCEDKGDIDELLGMIDTLVHKYEVSPGMWNVKTSIMHHALSTNNELIIDKCIPLYNESLKKMKNPVQPFGEFSIISHCLSQNLPFQKYMNTIYDPYLKENVVYLLNHGNPEKNLFSFLPLEETKELMQRLGISVTEFGLNALCVTIRQITTSIEDNLKRFEKINYLVENGCARLDNTMLDDYLLISQVFFGCNLRNDRYKLIKLLMEGGATMPKTSISQEIRTDSDVDIIQLLLENGASVHDKLWAMSPLIRVFSQIAGNDETQSDNLLEVAEILLKNGANPTEYYNSFDYNQYVSCIRLLHESSYPNIIEKGLNLLKQYNCTKENDIDPNGVDFETFIKGSLKRYQN